MGILLLFLVCFFFLAGSGGYWKDCDLTDMTFLLTSVIQFCFSKSECRGLQLQYMYTIIFNLRKIHSLGHASDDARALV